MTKPITDFNLLKGLTIRTNIYDNYIAAKDFGYLEDYHLMLKLILDGAKIYSAVENISHLSNGNTTPTFILELEKYQFKFQSIRDSKHLGKFTENDIIDNLRLMYILVPSNKAKTMLSLTEELDEEFVKVRVTDVAVYEDSVEVDLVNSYIAQKAGIREHQVNYLFNSQGLSMNNRRLVELNNPTFHTIIRFK